METNEGTCVTGTKPGRAHLEWQPELGHGERLGKGSKPTEMPTLSGASFFQKVILTTKSFGAKVRVEGQRGGRAEGGRRVRGHTPLPPEE